MAGAGGRSARGGASVRRGLQEDVRSVKGGEADSEGWSGESDDALYLEMEEEGWKNDSLTALPWGTQESGARGLRVDVRAGESDVRKSPSATADKAGMRGRHGAWQEQRAKNGGRRDWEEQNTQE